MRYTFTLACGHTQEYEILRTNIESWKMAVSRPGGGGAVMCRKCALFKKAVAVHPSEHTIDGW